MLKFVVFTQSHMAMFFLYKLLRDGVTVVYEKVQDDTVFVFPPTGQCRKFTGRGNVDTVPELENPNTVHLFDACAGVNAREPFGHPAKLAIFTSPNEISYKQLMRSGVSSLAVPSYTLEELDKRREFFPKVDADSYARKIDLFGCGSIRLVLGLDEKRSEELVEEAIENTTVINMLDVMQYHEVGANSGVTGPHALFATSLAPDADKNDIASYARRKVVWNISSPYIMRELIRRSTDDAMKFAARASVIFQDSPGLELSAGLFFENIAPAVLAKGGTFRVRQLLDGEERDEQWPGRNLVPSTHITKVRDVHALCNDQNTLFTFLKKMPAFDAHTPPHQYFNCTNSASHTINMEAAVTMCERLRASGGPSDKVHFYFIVPAHRFDDGWRGPQSYKGPGGQSNMIKLLDTTDLKTQQENRQKLGVDDKKVQLVASNLVQYALRLDLTGGIVRSAGAGVGSGQIRSYSTASRPGTRPGGSGRRVTVRVVQGIWKFIL